MNTLHPWHPSLKRNLRVLRVLRVNGEGHTFSSLPVFLKLFKGQIAKGVAVGFDLTFETVKSPLELIVRDSKRAFGFDAELASDVNERKQQVAELLFGFTRLGAGGAYCIAQLTHFLFHLINHIVRLHPVEAHL